MYRTPLMPSNCSCDARKSLDLCPPCVEVAAALAEKNARILELADRW